MKLAGRKIVESISIPGRPGCMAASASSTPRVTSIVLAHGNFSTTSRRPGPSLTMPSPIKGGWPCTTSATSLRRSWLPSGAVKVTRARSSGAATGRMWRTWTRWVPMSMNPPVPVLAPFL